MRLSADSRQEAKSHGQSLQEARDHGQSRRKPNAMDSVCGKRKLADSLYPVSHHNTVSHMYFGSGCFSTL